MSDLRSIVGKYTRLVSGRPRKSPSFSTLFPKDFSSVRCQRKTIATSCPYLVTVEVEAYAPGRRHVRHCATTNTRNDVGPGE